MEKGLPDVIADILACNGAIVERIGDGGLEVIAPPEVSMVLSIPEYARLCFSYNHTRGEAIYASYDSELFTSIASLLAGKGRFSIARLDSSPPNIEKLSRGVAERVCLGNATFRLDRSEVREVHYLLVYFRFSALSDEKTEGLIAVLINGLNLAAVSFEQGMEGLKEIEPEGATISTRLGDGLKGLIQSAHSACEGMVREGLMEFIRGLERRLNRDVKRVYEYYEELKVETRRAIEKKRASGEEDKLLHRLEAIETELKWKVQDLITKYTLTIQIEPVSSILIETQSPVFWIDIKRRLSSRPFPLTYNPLIRRFDPLPCESCFYPRVPYYICDEKLHILCNNCFKRCHKCGKQYCGVCYKGGCPKCHSNS
ncbi:MAG: hypothetical protein HY878_06105 [Deltaproteobacteria bacterium]|nr:hypothetical protein [Deltaproteobacteria bacterium]